MRIPTVAMRDFGTPDTPWWLAILAAVLTVAGQLLLDAKLLVGLLPAIAAAAIWARRGVSLDDARLPARAAVALALLAVAAAHVWGISEFPPGLFFDEAVNIEEGAELTAPLRLQTWSYELSGRPTLFLYICGAVYHLFGQLWAAARHLVVAFNLLTVVVMAWALVPAVGRRTAVLSAAVFGISAYHLLFSRIVYEASISTLFLLLAVGAALRAARDQGWRWWVVWGVGLGIGLWTYNAFRLVPVFFMVALAAWTPASRRPTRPLFARFAVGLAVALVIAAPLAVVVAGSLGEFTFRAAELSVAAEARAAGSWEPVRHNLATYPLMFFTNPASSNQIYHWPAFSPPTAVLLWVGLGTAIGAAARRHGLALLLLFWFLAGLVPGILTLSIEAPHWCRTLYALPPAAALAAIGLATVSGLFPRRWQAPVASALLLLVVGGELWSFHRRIVPDHEVHNFFYPRVSTAAIMARDRAEAGFAVQASDEFATEAFEERVFWTIVGGRAGRVEPVRIWETFPRYGCSEPVSMLVALRDARLVGLVGDLYPDAALTVHFDPFGRPNVRALEIDCTGPAPSPGAAAVLVRRTGAYRVDFEASVEIRLEGVAVTPGDPLFIPAGLWAIECLPSCGDAGVVLSGPETFALETALLPAPFPGHGLSALYRDHDGSTHRQLDRLIFPNQRGHLQPSFAIQWRGELTVPHGGTYEFRVEADDFGEVVIDGRSVLRYPHDEGFYRDVATLDLDAGEHPLRIEFEKRRGGLTFDLTWRPPWEEDFVPIDPEFFLPSERPRFISPHERPSHRTSDRNR